MVILANSVSCLGLGGRGLDLGGGEIGLVFRNLVELKTSTTRTDTSTDIEKHREY